MCTPHEGDGARRLLAPPETAGDARETRIAQTERGPPHAAWEAAPQRTVCPGRVSAILRSREWRTGSDPEPAFLRLD